MALKAWYPLINNSNDYSGYGNHLSGAVTHGVGSPVGGYMVESSTSRYIPSNPQLQSVLDGEEFTICFWQRQGTATSDWPDIIRWVSNSGTTSRYERHQQQYNRFNFWTNIGYGESGSAWNSWGEPSGFSLGKWYHTSIIKKNNKVTHILIDIYGDVKYEYSSTSATTRSEGIPDGNTFSLLPDKNAKTDISDLRLYDNALSKKEIFKIAQANILHYDFNTDFGQYLNLVNNADLSESMDTTPSDGRDEAIHDSDRITVGSWSGGYNGGVLDPSVGYHAQIVRYQGKEGKPCFKYINENGQFGYPGRWLGISSGYLGSLNDLGIQHGDWITIYYDYKVTNVNYRPRVGLYHVSISSGGNTWGESLLYAPNPPEPNRWFTCMHIFQVDTDWDLAHARNIIYVYGNHGDDDIKYVQNVQVRKGRPVGYSRGAYLKQDNRIFSTKNSDFTTRVADNSGYGYHSDYMDHKFNPIYAENPNGFGGNGSCYFREKATSYTVDNRGCIEVSNFPNLKDAITVHLVYHNVDVGNLSRGIIAHADNYLGLNGWALRTGWGDNMRYNVNGNSEASVAPGADNRNTVLTFTYDASTGFQRLYVDGSLKQSRTVTASVLGSSTNPLTIGGIPGHEGMRGWIFDVKIFGTVLSLTEIQRLHKEAASLTNRNEFITNQIEETISDANDTNLVNYKNWVIGSTGSQSGWAQNGATSENKIAVRDNPVGQSDVVWITEGNDTTSSPDGGFNLSSNYPKVDPTKTYRFSVWIRRVKTGNGSWYLGCYGLNASNGTALYNWNSTNLNGNPYFLATSSLPPNGRQNEWFLVVGYVTPAGDTNIPSDNGVYHSDGTRWTGTNSFHWAPDATNCRIRSYLYYSTDPDTWQYFYRPRIDLVDGTEPSLQTLLKCSEHRPLIDDNGDRINRKVSIQKNLVSKAPSFDEMGPTRGMVAYYPFKGDTKDYSGNGHHLTINSGRADANARYGLIGGQAYNQSIMQQGLLNKELTVYLDLTINETTNDSGARYGLVQVGNYFNELAMNIYGSQLQVYWDGTLNGSYSSTFLNPFSAGQRLRIVFTKDKDSAKVYINGVLSSTQNNVLIPATEGTTLEVGGSYTGDIWDTTKGDLAVIHECRIYNVALTEKEINTLSKTYSSFGKDGTIRAKNISQ